MCPNSDDVPSVDQLSGLTLDELDLVELKLCAVDFWYFAKFLVTDDEERQVQRAFPLDWPFLVEMVSGVEGNQKTLVLKSRRMMVSLTLLARFLWKAMFCGSKFPGTQDVYVAGYSAIDSELAEYQMSRVTAMYQRLPSWMKSACPMTTDNVLFKEFGGGGKIKGYALKRQGPQGFGFSEFLFDEAAWQETTRSTWMGLVPSIGMGKVIAVSTPNGSEGIGRFFWELWENPMKVPQFRDLYRMKFLWDVNPDHDEAWFKANTVGMDRNDIAQMYEGSFAAQSGKAVWTRFDRKTHVPKEPPEIIIGRPILLGWDLSTHDQAFLISQRNAYDQFIIHRELYMEDVGIHEFIFEALLLCAATYDRKKFPEIHFIDPAMDQGYHQAGVSGAISDRSEIELRFSRGRLDGGTTRIYRGAVHFGTRHKEGPRLREVRGLFPVRDDGRTGLVINSCCTMLIDGCGGGYAYPDKGGEDPVKNRFSHLQDALQYIVTGYNMAFGIKYRETPLDQLRSFKPPSRIKFGRINSGG